MAFKEGVGPPVLSVERFLMPLIKPVPFNFIIMALHCDCTVLVISHFSASVHLDPRGPVTTPNQSFPGYAYSGDH